MLDVSWLIPVVSIGGLSFCLFILYWFARIGRITVDHRYEVALLLTPLALGLGAAVLAVAGGWRNTVPLFSFLAGLTAYPVCITMILLTRLGARHFAKSGGDARHAGSTDSSNKRIEQNAPM